MEPLVKKYNECGLGWRLDFDDDGAVIVTSASVIITGEDLERILPHLIVLDISILSGLLADYRTGADR